jgi:23S rRNA (guanosine2251-2'-O)-methyltransferase
MARDELIFGLHAILSAIRAHPGDVLELWVDRDRQDARLRELLETADRIGLKAQPVDARVLLKKVGMEHHQGAVARYRLRPPLTEDDLFERLQVADEPPFVLVLDGVTDPHNLGACLRTAEATGVHAVIAPADRAARITPTVRKVASGAAERIPFVQVKNLARTLRRIKEQGVWLYGMDDHGETCVYDLRLTGPTALILGAEGKGLRRLTREQCDGLAYLPMVGEIESLNVSVAAGISLFEVVRQRRFTKRLSGDARPS